MKRIIAFIVAFALLLSTGAFVACAGDSASSDASSNAAASLSSAEASADSKEATTEAVKDATTEATTELVTTEEPTTEKPAVTLKWKKSTKTIKAGKKFTFKAVATGTTKTVKYSVNKTNIAKIGAKSGVLKAKKVGKVKVKATVENKTISIKVKVNPKKIVCIDPGHSGVVPSGSEPIGPGSTTMKMKMSSGTCGNYTHVPEYKLTMVMANKLKKLLVDRGYKVVMTRSNNSTMISNVERAKVANKAKADAYIRIHADSFTSPSVKGMSMQYAPTSNPYVGKKYGAKNYKLSKCVKDEFVKATGASVRGTGLFGRNDLSGSNWANVPTTLIELGFMSNPTEDRLMQTSDYQNKMAKGMANGIDAYFGY
ncbi:MAG: N-acetylmuramoyl-L-alanine amidase [Lachnospiraceae bacterium]|nr:N-acetylmuramoyl-L-alanine amidase [Lachnospiraceae bacterium]